MRRARRSSSCSPSTGRLPCTSPRAPPGPSPRASYAHDPRGRRAARSPRRRRFARALARGDLDLVEKDITGKGYFAYGGSADLTGSNNTKTGDLGPVEAGSFGGRYVYFGVREHAIPTRPIGDLIRRLTEREQQLAGLHDTAAAAQYSDLGSIFFFKQIDDVFEELDMPPLVARDSDAVGVLFPNGLTTRRRMGRTSGGSKAKPARFRMRLTLRRDRIARIE